MEQCKVVAEVGCSHLKKMDRAKMLIDLAVLAKADYVKFQKRNPIESVPKELQDKPHPNLAFAYGDTYLKHRQNLELTIDQHAELKEYCENHGIGYATSVWDITSALEVINLKPDYIKVPSACNGHFEMIDLLLSDYQGDIHISLGMSLPDEKFKLYNKLLPKYNDRIVLYHCTSQYPASFEQLYLREIEKLTKIASRVGFSNHGFGIAADIASFVLGCTWIERHFIDDRTVLHSDASASLEPDGLRRLCRDLKNVHKAMKFKGVEITKQEQEQRKKLRVLPDG